MEEEAKKATESACLEEDSRTSSIVSPKRVKTLIVENKRFFREAGDRGRSFDYQLRASRRSFKMGNLPWVTSL